MSFVKVKGFPPSANLLFILHKLKGLLPIAHFGKFWIREISDLGPNCRQATLELSSQQSVREAIECLNQFNFSCKGTTYYLEAYQDYSSSREQKRQRSRSQEHKNSRYHQRHQEHRNPRDQEHQSWRDQGRYDRNHEEYDFRRSQSPDFGSEDCNSNSNFDIEMDLLRQQSKIMEQERQVILMKKKKLEMMEAPAQHQQDNRGPNNYQNQSGAQEYGNNTQNFNSRGQGYGPNEDYVQPRSDPGMRPDFRPGPNRNYQHHRQEYGPDASNDLYYNAPLTSVEIPQSYNMHTYNDYVSGYQNPQPYESCDRPEYETLQKPSRPRHFDKPEPTWQPKRTPFPQTETQNKESRSKTNEIFRKPSKLPHFIRVSKILMEDVENFFPDDISEEQKKYLRSTITLTIRKRTSAALEGKPKLEKTEIIKLYRTLYPHKLDAKLVEKTLADLKAELKNGISNQNNDAENTASNSGNLNLRQPQQQETMPEQNINNKQSYQPAEPSVSPDEPCLELSDNGDWIESDINEWM